MFGKMAMMKAMKMEGQKVMTDFSSDLIRFVKESNAIEGINREPTQGELEATLRFIERRPDELSVSGLELLVHAYQPDARLRNKVGLDVRVGKHIAISGSPWVETKLRCLLQDAEHNRKSSWEIHCEYEKLHPFTDCNGRSGRALWLWMIYQESGRIPQLPFLHIFYYQTLENNQ